jgi:hypothetical protein
VKLHEIQQKLKAPKSQYNSFGKYHYRNAEDILEAVKPLLGESVLTISDEVVMLGNPQLKAAQDGILEENGARFYVKATATFKDKDEETSVTAYARESYDKKGMDAAQITGAASSYARKYALNGLFLIDDTKDADSDAPKEDVKPSQTRQTAPQRKPFEKPEKDPAVEEKARKDRIITLLRKLELPCTTKKECEDSVFTATGLLLQPEHYEEIGDLLAKELEANK